MVAFIIQSFSLRISSVSKTKSAVDFGFGHIYWRDARGKNSFFVQCYILLVENLFLSRIYKIVLINPVDL